MWLSNTKTIAHVDVTPDHTARMVKSLLFDVDVKFTASANTNKLIPMCFFEDILEHMTFHTNLIYNPPKLERLSAG